jgi:tetratricopeptide (TPR) repeat protein
VNDDSLERMREVRLAVDQVEVRRARSKIFAGVFGGSPSPTTVGRFEVRDRLGSGGMGIVYEAYDPQLDRRLALKVVRADASMAADGAARLVDEARAMAKLSHPNVLTVYEAGTVDTQVFIAMALVEGFTLRSWLEAAERSTDDILHALRDAGRGLSAAHAAGLVHRDFKPENVLVSAEGQVFVTDFGLARSFTADESGRWVEVSVGRNTTRMAGTPAYMAPEQLRGQPVDARADQFAWCVTACEALTGRRPFDDTTLQRVATEPDFVPEPVALPATLSVTRRVRTALERGLNVDPEQRFPSMGALLDASRPPRRAWVPLTVGTAVATMGIGAAVMGQADPCPARPEQLDGVWDREIRDAAAGAFAASNMPYAERAWASVDARTAQYVDQWVGLEQRACREEDDIARACLDRRKAEFGAVSKLLQLADAGVVEHAASMISTLPSLIDCTDPALAVRVADDNTSSDRTAVDEARALLSAGRYDAARTKLDRLVKELDNGDPAWLEVVSLQGEAALEAGDAAASAAAFERVLANASGTGGLLPTAVASVGLVEVQSVLSKTDFDAAAILARAAAIAVASAGNPPRLRTKLESARAALEIEQGNFDQGIELVEHARGVLSELGDDTRLEQAELAILAAKALFRKQQFDTASRLADESLAIFEETLGPDHPTVGQALLLPGSVALVRGDLDAAERHYTRAAEVFARTLGKGHSDHAIALVSLANVARAKGDYEKARDLTAEGLEGMAASFPEDNRRVMAARGNLASLDHQLGNLGAARTQYLEIATQQRATLGEHYELSITLANIARVEAELHDLEAARAAATEALKIRTAVFGETHDRTLSSRFLLTELDLLAGQNMAEVSRGAAEIRSLRESVLGETHPLTLETIVLQAKAALRANEATAALAFAEDALAKRIAAERPLGEVETCYVLVAQSALAAGQRSRAKEAAEALTWDGPLPSELRDWCDDCKAAMDAIAGGP